MAVLAIKASIRHECRHVTSHLMTNPGQHNKLCHVVLCGANGRIPKVPVPRCKKDRKISSLAESDHSSNNHTTLDEPCAAVGYRHCTGLEISHPRYLTHVFLDDVEKFGTLDEDQRKTMRSP